MTEWQPIETAPKDGTWILLTGGNIEEWDVDEEVTNNPPIVTARFYRIEWWGSDLFDWYIAPYDSGLLHISYENPTHWMPLPALPA